MLNGSNVKIGMTCKTTQSFFAHNALQLPVLTIRKAVDDAGWFFCL